MDQLQPAVQALRHAAGRITDESHRPAQFAESARISAERCADAATNAGLRAAQAALRAQRARDRLTAISQRVAGSLRRPRDLNQPPRVALRVVFSC